MTRAYIKGFCNTASERGVDPLFLMKSAQFTMVGSGDDWNSYEPWKRLSPSRSYARHRTQMKSNRFAPSISNWTTNNYNSHRQGLRLPSFSVNSLGLSTVTAPMNQQSLRFEPQPVQQTEARTQTVQTPRQAQIPQSVKNQVTGPVAKTVAQPTPQPAPKAVQQPVVRPVTAPVQQKPVQQPVQQTETKPQAPQLDGIEPVTYWSEDDEKANETQKLKDYMTMLENAPDTTGRFPTLKKMPDGRRVNAPASGDGVQIVQGDRILQKDPATGKYRVVGNVRRQPSLKATQRRRNPYTGRWEYA